MQPTTTLKRVAYSALALLVLQTNARAVYQLVTLAKPVRANSLSGVVRDPTGEIVSNATVDLIDCPVGRSYGMPAHLKLATAQTDSQGEFRFDRQKLRKPYCFRITAVGFDPLEFEVKLSLFAGKVKVKLPIGG
jgi:hypothetical protein